MKKARINEFKVSLMLKINVYESYFAERMIDFGNYLEKI